MLLEVVEYWVSGIQTFHKMLISKALKLLEAIKKLGCVGSIMLINRLLLSFNTFAFEKGITSFFLNQNPNPT